MNKKTNSKICSMSDCGVFGVSKTEGESKSECITALLSLQHRGQDAAGIAYIRNGSPRRVVGKGLVSEALVFSDECGPVAIAHNRYRTSGRTTIKEVQPFTYGNVAVAHNGHVVNYEELKDELEKDGYRFNTTSDSECILYLLDRGVRKHNNTSKAVREIMELVEGAYSIVSLIGENLVAFRDPRGIRPLSMGIKNGSVAFASETVALTATGYRIVEEVLPGEMVEVHRGKKKRKVLKRGDRRFCMFELVYFSRPDSIYGGKSVHEIRKRLGAELYKESRTEADIVVPVPDTSRSAAIEYSRLSGIPYEEGIIKNRYVGRTFIMPTQEERAKAVKLKLCPNISVLKGKRIILIDDSIVRGTTMKTLVEILRTSGVKEIHLKITCPPIRSPCYYGINMPNREHLIASGREEKEVKEYIGVDSLHYLSEDGLKRAVGKEICTGCINGDYGNRYVSEYIKNIGD